MSRKISRRAALGLAGGVALGAATVGIGTAEAARRKGSGAGEAAAAASDWVRLPVITANIGRKNLGQRDAAIAAVRNANGDPDRPMVGWQEIGEGDGDTGEPAMINQHFGSVYNNMFLNDASDPREPISVPSPWVVTGHTTTPTHGGIAGVTPARFINEVVVAHQTIPGLQFVLMNTHYLAGAYTGEHSAQLQQLWNQHKQIHAQRIAERHDNQNLAVIWTADTNNPNYGTATGWQAEGAAFGDGIDRVDWLDNGKVEIQLVNTGVIPMNVDDHNARMAIFHLRTTG